MPLDTTDDGRRIDNAEIIAAHNRIRGICRAAATHPLTNFIPTATAAPSTRHGVETDKAFVFSERDGELDRVSYIAVDRPALAACLPLLTRRPLCLDCVVRGDERPPEEVFIAAGYEHLATYERLSTVKLPDFLLPEPVDFAGAEDADRLLELLHTDFDPFLDHFPGRDVLLAMISNRHVIVHRNGTAITGYFLFPVKGQRAHLNYWQSHDADPAVGSRLLTQAYALMRRAGATSAYAWVNVANTRVAKIHRRLGLTPDSIHDYIYAIKK